MSNIVLRVIILAVVLGFVALMRQIAGNQQGKRGLRVRLAIPKLPDKMPFWADAAKIAFVERQVAALRTIPWGENVSGDRQQAQARYAAGLAIAYDAGGEFGKLSGAVEAFVQCPKPLALAGAAEVIMRLAYVRGTYYIPQGIQESVSYTTQALRVDPQCAEAWFTRVLALCFFDGEYALNLATLALTQARKYGKDMPRLALVEANYYRRIGAKEQRIASLWKAVAAAAQGQLTPPERMSALDGLGLALLENNQLDDAIKVYQQLNTEFPQSAWGWHNASVVYDKAGRLQEALACSDTALSFFEFSNARQRNSLVRLKLGMPVTLIEQPRTDEEREAAAGVRALYAAWLKEQGSAAFPQAEHQFRLALQFAPQRADTHYQYALFYEEQMQQRDLAIAEYTDAVQYAPDRPQFRLRLAQALTQAGPSRAADAEREFQILIQQGPRFFDVHREYGRLLLYMGRLDEAEREARLALKFRSKDNAANQLLITVVEARKMAGAQRR